MRHGNQAVILCFQTRKAMSGISSSRKVSHCCAAHLNLGKVLAQVSMEQRKRLCWSWVRRDSYQFFKCYSMICGMVMNSLGMWIYIYTHTHTHTYICMNMLNSNNYFISANYHICRHRLDKWFHRKGPLKKVSLSQFAFHHEVFLLRVVSTRCDIEML